MAWVAVDRAVKSIEQFGLPGPLQRWRAMRAEIHREVCTKGWNPTRRTFTQYYGSDATDSSLLMIPLVGFLPPTDDRVKATVAAIQADLTEDGFVRRYQTESSGAVDGLSGSEGVFLACSFWLADNLHLIGQHQEARELFERLIGLRNDVGLLAEEYAPAVGRQVGNFPQAFSHVSLVNCARNLSAPAGPVMIRTGEAEPEAMFRHRRRRHGARIR
jgi:GH15 family glucan-1,4-alpha-glucosidase